MILACWFHGIKVEERDKEEMIFFLDIDNLKEEVRRIEVELEQEKIKMETSLCRAYRKGYDNGILAGGKKYSEKKDVEKVKNTRPSTIDEWFKMRMGK